MKIDEMEEVQEFLEDMKYFFGYIDCERDRLEKELRVKEDEFKDIRHEIELSNLNTIEIHKIYKQEKQILQERRILKNKIEFINTLRGFTSKFITKGICAETSQAIQNIETLKKKQENRAYRPRVLKNLKCAKKEDLDEEK